MDTECVPSQHEKILTNQRAARWCGEEVRGIVSSRVSGTPGRGTPGQDQFLRGTPGRPACPGVGTPGQRYYGPSLESLSSYEE